MMIKVTEFQRKYQDRGSHDRYRKQNIRRQEARRHAMKAGWSNGVEQQGWGHRDTLFPPPF